MWQMWQMWFIDKVFENGKQNAIILLSLLRSVIDCIPTHFVSF